VIQSSELDIHLDPTSYPSLSKSLKDYLSYQTSLRYNLGEFPGVITGNLDFAAGNRLCSTLFVLANPVLCDH
jgi:hypothetical protein